MNDERRDLSDLLGSYGGAPDHLPGFEARLLAGLDEADRDMGRARHGWFHLPRRPRLFVERRPFLATAVAAAMVAVVAALVLVGLPGVSRVTGPEPVSAAAVIQKALDAISSGETLQADITERYVTSVSYPGPVVEDAVVHGRLLARSDGSMRVTQTGELPGPEDPRPTEPIASGPLPFDPGLRDWAYDASRGVVCDYYESSESPRFCTGILRGMPLGPPDIWANFQGDLTATALALQAGKAATVDTTAYDGRPAWVVTMSGSLALRSPGEVYSVTVDQETCLPVRVQAIDGTGIVQFDYALHDVRVDEPIPDAAFSFSPPQGTTVTHDDAGFRRLPLERIAAKPGYELLLPARLPGGYVQKWSAFAPRATTANGEISGTYIVEVQYMRGFDTLTVTTRRVADPAAAANVDPIEPDITWADLVHKDVTLAAGAFEGVSAQLVVAPRITVPHLYAVKDGILVTVAGSASAKELIAIAESLQPYGAD